jgi:low temperature requirement protein LtrA
MGGAVAMAVNISSAFNNNFSGFAISYAFMRLILVIEYVRVFRAIKSSESESAANPLVKRYIIGFSIAAIIWLISAFVPFTEIRFVLWVIGLIVDFATPISTIKLPKFAPHISHLPERMGLFTIIVLGESIISIVTGMTEQVWNVYSVTVSSLGLCISFSLWWLYFDSTGRLPIQILKKGRTFLFSIWLFTHFPLVVAITAVGVGIRRLVSSEQHSVLSTSDLWLICGSVAVSLFSQSVLHLVSIDQDTHDFTRRKKFAISRIVSAIVIISIPILLNNYGIPIIIAALITGVCGFQIVFDLKYHPHHRIFKL